MVNFLLKLLYKSLHNRSWSNKNLKSPVSIGGKA